MCIKISTEIKWYFALILNWSVLICCINSPLNWHNHWRIAALLCQFSGDFIKVYWHTAIALHRRYLTYYTYSSLKNYNYSTLKCTNIWFKFSSYAYWYTALSPLKCIDTDLILNLVKLTCCTNSLLIILPYSPWKCIGVLHTFSPEVYYLSIP